ncbi:MAG TPA: hypothetical protein VN673_18375, partial [Clostridia bacterium]|nr:hypothetical protein [Clostridia bacterium]
MKNFIGKLRISAAIDSSEPMPAGLRRMISSSTSLRAFERSARELDQQLKVPVEKNVPADLHASIMRRVRASDREAPARPGLWFSRWVP